MGIDVTIRAKGLFGKPPELKDILHPGIGYGILDDAFRLQEGKTGEYTLIYDMFHIGRGYEVKFNKKSVYLRLSLPAGVLEIQNFYRLVERICGLMGTKRFVRDEETVGLEDIETCIACDMEGSLRALKTIEENIAGDKYRSMYLFGVMHPIAVGVRELKRIDGSLDRLDEFFHEMQNMDAYYAKANAYRRQDGSIFGVYALSAGVKTILPFKPGFFMNDEIQVDDWNIGLVLSEETHEQMSYDQFLEKADVSAVYDTEHFMITLSEEEMREMVTDVI